MSVDVWGLIPKSQTDPETIEEAIERIVSEHNDLPTAHTGGDRALEAHRSFDVLDHRAGSVLADKTTSSEIFFRSSFESLDGWTKVGSPAISSFPTVAIYVERGAVNKSEIVSNPQVPSNFFDTNFNMMLQISGRWDGSNTNLDAWWGLGLSNANAQSGMGFVYHNGVLRAGYDDGLGGSFSATLPYSITQDHVYRVQYVASEQTAYFYIDGEEVATLLIPNNRFSDDSGPRFGASVAVSNDGNLFFSDLICARALVNL